MILSEVQKFLRDAPHHWETRESTKVQESLALLKTQAVSKENEAFAKDIWCYEALLKAQDKYIQAFSQIREGDFYEAWCNLEQAEIKLHHLRKHFQDQKDQYCVSFMEEHIKKIQSLYPYKLFSSIGFVKKEVRCGICNSVITPRSNCGHRKGEIYRGVMCTHIVTELEFFESSFVTSPRHKYAVPFLVGEDGEKYDQYDYTFVDQVICTLNSPFQWWDYEWTKKEVPHYLYKNLDESEACPCESGIAYGECCRKRRGVIRPRLQVYLKEPLPTGVPSEVFINFPESE